MSSLEFLKNCLNEWNVTIEALGQGEQTLLVRKYGTTIKQFLLYPTVTYAHKDGYLRSFKDDYQSFAEENALPKIDGNEIEVKYYATVERVIEAHVKKIGSLNKYHIWTNEHIKSYLGNEKAYVWILRVYMLNESVMAERTKGIKYSHLMEEVSLADIKPVLSHEKFSKISKKINKTLL